MRVGLDGTEELSSGPFLGKDEKVLVQFANGDEWPVPHLVPEDLNEKFEGVPKNKRAKTKAAKAQAGPEKSKAETEPKAGPEKGKAEAETESKAGPEKGKADTESKAGPEKGKAKANKEVEDVVLSTARVKYSTQGKGNPIVKLEILDAETKKWRQRTQIVVKKDSMTIQYAMNVAASIAHTVVHVQDDEVSDLDYKRLRDKLLDHGKAGKHDFGKSRMSPEAVGRLAPELFFGLFQSVLLLGSSWEGGGR